MCDHDRGWAVDRSERYARALGAEKGALEALPEVRGIERYRTVLTPVGGPPIELLFVVWSPLSRPVKDAILYDAEPPAGSFPYARASLNRTLKEGLLNRCLADAVIYSGAAGAPIRQGMEQVVCELLRGRLEAGGSCGWPTDIKPPPLVFVTESLGSKVLFDAVRRLRERAIEEPVEATRLEAAVAQTRAIYMLANQVPLLDLADALTSVDPGGPEAAPSPSRSSLAQFLTLVRAGRGQTAGGPEKSELSNIQLVAFTDPNDLLSYRLLPEQLGLEASAVRLVNVIVSNAPTWFGIVERPDYAHQRYGRNEAVAELLTRGNHP
jgi:hypothetical protein